MENCVSIEARWNPLTGKKVVLYVANMEKGPVAAVKNFLRWPIKLSDTAARELHKKITDAKDLEG